MQGWGTISEEGPLSPPRELSEAGPLGPEGEGDAGGNGSGQDVCHHTWSWPSNGQRTERHELVSDKNLC